MDKTQRLVLQEWDDWAAKNVPSGEQVKITNGLIFLGLSAKPTPSASRIQDDEWRPMADSAWMAVARRQDHSNYTA